MRNCDAGCAECVEVCSRRCEFGAGRDTAVSMRSALEPFCPPEPRFASIRHFRRDLVHEFVHVNRSRRYVLISPCRDEAQYLRRTLDSVAAQSVPPSLWIVVDDGSTDDTPAILEEYGKRSAKHRSFAA